MKKVLLDTQQLKGFFWGGGVRTVTAVATAVEVVSSIFKA
jgi:hypothetical protein